MRSRSLLNITTALIILVLIIGCGGTKETVTTLPEESAVTDAAATDSTGAETVEAEPVVEVGVIVEFDDSPAQLTEGEADNGIACYHPDGMSIVYQSNRDGKWQIYQLDLIEQTETRLIESEFNDENPVWSEDGSLLLFVSDRGNEGDEWNRDIYSFDPVEGIISRLTDSPGDDWFPIPLDAESFLFLSERSASADIPVYHRKNALYKGYYDGTIPPQLIAGEEINPSSPAVMLNGQYAFRDVNGQIVILDPISGVREKVTPSSIHCGFISVDADNNRLVFTGRESTDFQLYFLDVLSRTIQQAGVIPSNVRYPRFSPDATSVLYTATVNEHFQVFEQSFSQK